MMENVNYWFLRRLLKYSSPLTGLYDHLERKRYENITTHTAPVFILGVPRSGTTILYQSITNFLDVSYIDNLVNLSRESALFGFFLSHLFFDNKPHNNFHSQLGKTIGLHAPSEAGQYWYKFFPKNIPDIDIQDVDQRKMNDLKKDIDYVLNKYKRPYVIKNLYFVERIRIIKKYLPSAKYIVVERDEVDNICSIYRVRKALGDLTAWWSVKPRFFSEIQTSSVWEEIAAQVLMINLQIRKDLSDYSKEKIFFLKYEDFFNSPAEILKEIASFIGAGVKKHVSMEDFKLNYNKPVCDLEIREIEKVINTVLKRIMNG